MEKPEFEPILSAGFHEIEISQLEILFVNNFANNSKRLALVNQLRDFLEELSKIHSNFEIWLDGSFTTMKVEPEDIDILIIYNNASLNSLSYNQRKMVRNLFDRDLSKIRYNIDILLCADDDVKNRSYWRGWFGFSRAEQPKGIAKFNYGHN